MKKLIPASLLALSIAASSPASAQDMFAFMAPGQDASSTIVINPLNASADGYVAVFDHHANSVGELLGVARVRQGANSEIRVQLGNTVRRNTIAFLFVGNDFMDPSKAVDSIEIDIK